MPLDLSSCLSEGLQHGPCLLFCTLWVSRTLWFLPWDPGSLAAVQPVAAQLAAVRLHEGLRPSARCLQTLSNRAEMCLPAAEP